MTFAPTPAAHVDPTSPVQGVERRADRRSAWPLPAYVLGALGLVALGVSTYFEIRGWSDLSSLRRTCAPHCLQSMVDQSRTELRIGDVSGGIGLLSLGGATWVVLSRPLAVGHGPSPVLTGSMIGWQTAF